jgi:hypothetical protein
MRQPAPDDWREQTMRFPKRDLIATALVTAAGLLYGLWAAGSAPPGMSGTRATGLVVLALGFAASASAVVPTFDRLLHGSKAYLALTSGIGLVAVIAGVLMLAGSSEVGLGVVMVAMVVLWAIATVHHAMLTRTVPTRAGRARSFGPPSAAAH